MNTAHAAILTAALGSTATAQSWNAPGLRLPTNTSTALVAAVDQDDVESVLRTGLTGKGDTIELELGASGSFGRRGGEGGLVVAVERVSGGYEMQISASAMGTLGLDFGKDMAVTAKSGGEAVVVLELNGVQGVMRTLNALRMLKLLDPSAVTRQLEDALDELAKKSKVAAAARDAWDAAKKADDKAADAVDDAKKEFDKLKKEFDKANDKFKDAEKKLDKAKKDIEKAWPISEVLKKALDAAKAVVKTTERAYDAAKSAKNKASNAWDKAKDELKDTGKKLKAKADEHKVSKAVVDSIDKSVEGLRDVANRIQGFQHEVLGCVRGFEFSSAKGLDLEAAAGDLGINLGQVEMDLAGSVSKTKTLRFELPAAAGDPIRVTLAVAHGVELGFDAQSGMRGVSSAAGLEFVIEAVFSKQSGRGFRFDARSSGTTCELDIEVLQTAGASAKALFGAGRTMSMFIDYPTWKQALKTGGIDLSQGLSFGSFSSLNAEIAVQDRLVAAVSGEAETNAKFDLQIEGSLTLSDVGRERTYPATAGGFAASIIDPNWVRAELLQLANR